MPITTSDFSSLTDDLQEIFNEALKVGIGDVVGKDIFDVKNIVRRTYDYLVLHGVNGIQEVAQGQDYPVVNSDEGDTITYTQRQFAASFQVTKQMRLFDLYDQIESLARSLADSAAERIDYSMADVLGNGWATSYTDIFNGTVTSVGPNGLALFSTAQTNAVSTSNRTFRNQIRTSTGVEDPTLTRDGVVTARKDALTYRDPEGHVKPINYNVLLVSPTNEDQAMRIVFSDQMSGTGNNDINPLKGKLTVKVWPRLEQLSGGTDRAAYWYMYDSSKVKETLKAIFAQQPMLFPPEQVSANKNWKYDVDFLYTLGIGYQAYISGSRGLNAGL